MIVDRRADEIGLESHPGMRRAGVGGLVAPVVIALVAAALVLAVVVASSPSVWRLLGAGRGLVPEEYFAVWGYVIVLATTIGQAVGWAAGSAILYAALTSAGLRSADLAARIAMSVVYVGLGALPLLVYHAVFGGPLLGLPREGLAEWLLANHADAHALLVRFHPAVDLAVIPLGILFLGVLWLTGERARAGAAVRTVLALAVAGTSLAVALSLAIHATIAHVRLG